MTGHYNKLTPAEAERLAMLAEECAEVIQVVGKILRHGYESFHPNDPLITNREILCMELMDLHAVVELMDNDLPRDPKDNIGGKYLDKKLSWTHHQIGDQPRGGEVDERPFPAVPVRLFITEGSRVVEITKVVSFSLPEQKILEGGVGDYLITVLSDDDCKGQDILSRYKGTSKILKLKIAREQGEEVAYGRVYLYSEQPLQSIDDFPKETYRFMVTSKVTRGS